MAAFTLAAKRRSSQPGCTLSDANTSEKSRPATGQLFSGRIVPTEAKPSELSGEIL
jgi:hypothetical protein